MPAKEALPFTSNVSPLVATMVGWSVGINDGARVVGEAVVGTFVDGARVVGTIVVGTIVGAGV